MLRHYMHHVVTQQTSALFPIIIPEMFLHNLKPADKTFTLFEQHCS